MAKSAVYPTLSKIFLIPELLRNGAKLQQPKGVALRWVINADGEGGMQLLLQALPSPAATINARPAFKRDSCPGISVVNMNLSVEIDYNPITIGPTPTLFSTNPDTTKQILSTSRSARINMIKGKKNTEYRFSTFPPTTTTVINKKEKMFRSTIDLNITKGK